MKHLRLLILAGSLCVASCSPSYVPKLSHDSKVIERKQSRGKFVKGLVLVLSGYIAVMSDIYVR